MYCLIRTRELQKKKTTKLWRVRSLCTETPFHLRPPWGSLKPMEPIGSFSPVQGGYLMGMGPRVVALIKLGTFVVVVTSQALERKFRSQALSLVTK